MSENRSRRSETTEPRVSQGLGSREALVRVEHEQSRDKLASSRAGVIPKGRLKGKLQAADFEAQAQRIGVLPRWKATQQNVSQHTASKHVDWCAVAGLLKDLGRLVDDGAHLVVEEAVVRAVLG